MNATGDRPRLRRLRRRNARRPTLAASNIEHNLATLTIGNHSGNWYYKANLAPHASCSSTAVTTNSTALSNLSGNTSYYYTAYSDRSCSTEIASASAFLTKPATPAKPTAVSGAGSGKLTLSSSVTGGGALTKWQYRQKGADDTDFGSWQDIKSTSNTLRHTVSGLTDGTNYTFEVRAVNTTGTGPESDESASAAPWPVVGLTASDVTATTAKLAISGWSGVWSYKDGQKEYYISCTNVAAGTAEASLSGLTPGQDYLVYAYGKHDCPVNDNDNTWGGARSVIFTTLLSKVEGVSVSASAESLTVDWTAQSGVTGYHVQWKSGTEDWSSDRQENATTNSATISSLTAGANYTVRVRSYHRNYVGRIKYGEWSDPATTPARLTVSNLASTSATVTISGYIGKWYYDISGGTKVDCTNAGISGSSVDLTGLAQGSDHNFTAWSTFKLQAGITRQRGFQNPGDRRGDAARRRGAGDGPGPCAGDGAAGPEPHACGGRDADADERARQYRARLADGAPGAGLTLAGQPVPLHAGVAPAGSAGGSCATGGMGRYGFGHAGSGSAGPVCGAADSWTVGSDELFRTSAFDVLLGAAPGEAGALAGPLWSLWGRGDFGSFEGRPEPGSSYSGEMRTGWLGFDGRAGPWVAGIAVSHGESETDYDFDSGGGIDGRGRLETELTAVYPYGRWTLPNGLELRGAVGVGSGEAHHRPEEGVRETSDLSMRMASTGVRRALPMPGGLDLALRADASVVRMDTADGLEIVSGVSADSWRLRAGLEASRRFELDDGVALEPFAEAAGRRDGGDGVTGTGLEVAGGVRYTAPRLQVEARGRWLAAHSEEGARERGVSVTARVGPGAAGARPVAVSEPALGARTRGRRRRCGGRDAGPAGRRGGGRRARRARRLRLCAGAGGPAHPVRGDGAFGGRGPAARDRDTVRGAARPACLWSCPASAGRAAERRPITGCGSMPGCGSERESGR